jgi:transposase-like protein
MPKKNPPTGTDADLNLAAMYELFADEDKTRQFLENRRWQNGPVCPHCKAKQIYALIAKPGSNHPVPKGTYKCGKCREKFTVRIGTVFEDSRLPLSKWLMAFHLLCSSKKGMSSHQIARELGITQKSAWFLNHRIREAMKQGPSAQLLKGQVEVGETYVDGKPRKGTVPHKRGRGTKKTRVMVLIERGGDAHCQPLEQVDAESLKKEIAVWVSREAIIMT